MVKNTKKLPKISIVIPSFNKVGYIKDTLQSIVDQKYPNLEVIIQDGGSTDGSLDTIKFYAKQYPKIFQFVSKKDNGQVDAINTGLKKATGDIVTYINADDVYKKDALIMVAKAFTKSPEAFWFVGYGDIIDQNGKIVSSWVTKYKNFLLNLNKYHFLLMVNYISQPSVFLTNTAYKKYGPFQGTKKYVMEYETWLKIAKDKMPSIIEKTLASFRLTVDNISATSFKELLKMDYEITTKYTSNKLILMLHSINNICRVALINVIKLNDRLN